MKSLLLTFTTLEMDKLERYLKTDFKSTQRTQMMEPVEHGRGSSHVPVLLHSTCKWSASEKDWLLKRVGEGSCPPMVAQGTAIQGAGRCSPLTTQFWPRVTLTLWNFSPTLLGLGIPSQVQRIFFSLPHFSGPWEPFSPSGLQRGRAWVRWGEKTGEIKENTRLTIPQL